MDDDGRGYLINVRGDQWVWIVLEPVGPPAFIFNIHNYTLEVLHLEEDIQQD